MSATSQMREHRFNSFAVMNEYPVGGHTVFVLRKNIDCHSAQHNGAPDALSHRRAAPAFKSRSACCSLSAVSREPTHHLRWLPRADIAHAPAPGTRKMRD